MLKVHYRYRETAYHIALVQRSDGDERMRVTVDGVEQLDGILPLIDDRREHPVEVSILTVRGGTSLSTASLAKVTAH
jgi:hypothetical protein